MCVYVFLDMHVCVSVCLQSFLYSARLSNLFWFCLVSRTRSQLPFKGQIWAKWAALSYGGNRLNKALCLHHWLSHTRSHSMLNLQWAAKTQHTLETHILHIRSIQYLYTNNTQTQVGGQKFFLIKADLIKWLTEISFLYSESWCATVAEYWSEVQSSFLLNNNVHRAFIHHFLLNFKHWT